MILKIIVSVYAKPFDSEPTEVIEFTGTLEQCKVQLVEWANEHESVIFDMEVIDGGQMTAQYGLNTGGSKA